MKSIFDKSKMIFAGLSEMHFVITFKKAGSENASKRPVRRNNWWFSLTSRVPRKLTVRFNCSGIGTSLIHASSMESYVN
jgi:hypothetical protein